MLSRKDSHRGADAVYSLAAYFLALVAAMYFGFYRVRFVGGCDSAAYFVEALRLRGVDAGLAPDPGLAFPDAFAPLCMVQQRGIVHSIFPPGFSVLLAGAGVVGLELYVTAFFGAVGGLLLFLLARRKVGGPIALGAMVAWYAAPMTFWGSTQVMSDYVAACFVIGAFLAADRGHAASAGLVLGIALGVRPTCVLAAPALAIVLARSRSSWRACARALAALTAAVVAWALFVRLSFGTFATPYANNLAEMRGEHFGHQLRFLLAETGRQYALAAPLALVGLVRAPRACVVPLVWFAPFVLFHALWRMPYEAWWHIRFLASGLPAVVLAGAMGAGWLRRAAADRSTRPIAWRRALAAAGCLALAMYVGWSALLSDAAWLRTRDFDANYPRDVARIAKLVPRDAIVGSREHSIPLRLYGHFQSFQWCDAHAPALVRAALSSGRSVYAVFLFHDENGCPEQSLPLRAELGATPIATLPSGARLVRIGERSR
jgi:hypothetical protein